MEKKYQVFVSSTYKDLVDERQQVMQALLELDCIPVGMELFPAADDDQWTLIKELIYDCDYYILIIGGRYGSVNPRKSISYTQMEYEYAVRRKIPIISFIHKNPGRIESNKTEQSEVAKENLSTFIKLAEKKLCKYWETPAELKGLVIVSLTKTIKTKPRPGWIKSTYFESYKEEKKATTKQDSALSGIWDEYYEPDKFKEKEQKQTLVFNLDHQGPRITGTLIGDDNPNYPNLPQDEQHDLRKFVVNGNLKGSLVSLTAIIDSDEDKGHTVYLLEVKNSNSILEGITIYYDLDEKVLTTARTKLVKRKDYFSKGLLK